MAMFRQTAHIVLVSCAASVATMLFLGTVYSNHNMGNNHVIMSSIDDEIEDRLPSVDCPLAAQSQASRSQATGEYVLRNLAGMGIAKSLAGPQTAWDDPRLLTLLRETLLEPRRPFIPKLSYPLFKTPQAERVDQILRQKTKGFYVECGGLDGERSSNTIWLEKTREWKGLLIEMDPSYYLQLRGKNRQAFTSNVCLSPQKYPTVVNFTEHWHGQGSLQTDKGGGLHSVPTFCVPLYSMMLAMNRTKIDYFSLDVEGFEVPILKTIPFDKLDITVLTVEYNHGKGTKEYTDLMTENGYTLHSTIDIDKESISLYAHDLVFVKNEH